jgi:hypothetical protein
LRRGALYKGLFGGSRGWLAVGAVLWGRGALKRFFGRQEEIVTVEKMTNGQLMQLNVMRPPTRRERRKAQRRAA